MSRAAIAFSTHPPGPVCREADYGFARPGTGAAARGRSILAHKLCAAGSAAPAKGRPERMGRDDRPNGVTASPGRRSGYRPESGSRSARRPTRLSAGKSAGVAEGFAAEEYRAFLLHAVGLGRHAGASITRSMSRPTSVKDARRARRLRSSTVRARPLKKGSALDPQGFDAGKKVIGRKRHIPVEACNSTIAMVSLVVSTG
jgi:hypothetical protein